MSNAQRPDSVQAAQTLTRMLAGSWVGQSIHVVAKLGIADLLGDEAAGITSLAQAAAADADALYRVMRALASVGLFTESPPKQFALTPLGAALRSDAPGSVRPFAIMMGSPYVWESWGDLLHSVRTGEPAFEHVFGMQLFDYYGAHPDVARIGAAGLTSRSIAENLLVVGAYDFSAAETIVDVGGGQGTLLASILDANPKARGVLYDMPHVVATAQPNFAALQRDRYELVAGNFFESVPRGGDLYVLKKVIHDWDDARARSILANCRAAMAPGAQIALVELVVPEDNEPSFAKLLDLLMLVLPGGRERTEAEHQALLASAGLALNRVIPTSAAIAVIEASPSSPV